MKSPFAALLLLISSSARADVALIQISPCAIVQTWQGDTAPFLNVPGQLIQALDARAGWISPDGGFKLVTITQFAPPAGYQVIGNPTYATDAQCNVSQNFAITPILTLQVTSTGTPAISGTYPVSSQIQLYVISEMVSVLANGTFTDGTQSINWNDVAGTPHAFTVAQFKTLATAIAKAVNQTINGQLPTPATIP